MSETVLRTITEYTSVKERATEAGGILIGSYRGPHVEVVTCTTPFSDDIRRRYLFDRRDPKHQAAALSAWQSSGRTETFVGEWHTHPENHPSPSRRDLKTWHEIMSKNPLPQVFVVVGWESIMFGVGISGSLRQSQHQHFTRTAAPPPTIS